MRLSCTPFLIYICLALVRRFGALPSTISMVSVGDLVYILPSLAPGSIIYDIVLLFKCFLSSAWNGSLHYEPQFVGAYYLASHPDLKRRPQPARVWKRYASELKKYTRFEYHRQATRPRLSDHAQSLIPILYTLPGCAAAGVDRHPSFPPFHSQVQTRPTMIIPLAGSTSKVDYLETTNISGQPKDVNGPLPVRTVLGRVCGSRSWRVDLTTGLPTTIYSRAPWNPWKYPRHGTSY